MHMGWSAILQQVMDVLIDAAMNETSGVELIKMFQQYEPEQDMTLSGIRVALLSLINKMESKGIDGEYSTDLLWAMLNLMFPNYIGNQLVTMPVADWKHCNSNYQMITKVFKYSLGFDKFHPYRHRKKTISVPQNKTIRTWTIITSIHTRETDRTRWGKSSEG